MSVLSEFTLFRRFGNRTSSLISLYPHFSSFTTHDSGGELRYLERKKIVAVANEPLAPVEKRATLILNFFNHPRFSSKSKLAFPVSEELALELKSHGLFVWQIGAEPVFKLSDIFSKPAVLSKSFPSAMSLKRRGGKLDEVKDHELEVMSDLIEELKEEWLGKKKLSPLGFLNVVEPQLFKEVKRYFVLKDRGRVSALLTACPIYENENIVGYFFNDILKRVDSKNATTELLILETMRVLHEEGVHEVRLGMSPLALLSKETKDYKKLQFIYEKLKFGYNFQSLFFFKNKMKPTSWRPLYLVSDKPDFFRMIKNVVALHIDAGFLLEFLKRYWYASKRSLELKELVSSHKLEVLKNKSLPSILFRIKWTLCLMCFFVGLHLFKVSSEMGQQIFDHSGYSIAQTTWLGLFIAPLFHNHAFHLFGDQLSFLIFGAAIEYTFGSTLFFLMTGLGLWLTNPITHGLLLVILKPFSSFHWGNAISEIDYGSSNAVFALVGACLLVLKRNAWLFWPFLFYAIYICLQRESFLALHHFVAIFLGFAGTALYFHLAKTFSFRLKKQTHEK